MTPASSEIQGFVIHLARSAIRAENAQSLGKSSPVPTFNSDAVDGAELTNEQIQQHCSPAPLHSPKYPFALNKSEVGAFMSHRAVWKAIVDRQLRAGLVFEDDTSLDSPAFQKAFELARDHIESLGYILFPTKKEPKLFKTLESRGGVRIVRPTVAPLGARAQLVSHAAAKALYEETRKFDRPVDTFLQMHWVTGTHVHCVIPSGAKCIDRELGGSAISQKIDARSKIPREFKRLAYRSKVRAISSLAALQKP